MSTSFNTSNVTFQGHEEPLTGYLAQPRSKDPQPAIVVIQEVWGLVDHIKSVADRFAEKGFVALAPGLYSRREWQHLLTPTNIEATMKVMMTIPPEKRRDPNTFQKTIGSLPADKRELMEKIFQLIWSGGSKEKFTDDLHHAVNYLRSLQSVRGDRIGSIGFCMGGGLSINLACKDSLAACIVFYGESPQPIEVVEKLSCPVSAFYAGLDPRINAMVPGLVEAMIAYNKSFEMKLYPNVPHGFFNDTRENYRKQEAEDAWKRTLAFLEKTLRS